MFGSFFKNTPGFHTGGLVKLRPGEIPVLLSSPEAHLPRAQAEGLQASLEAQKRATERAASYLNEALF